MLGTLTPHHLDGIRGTSGRGEPAWEGGNLRGPKLKDDQFLVSPAIFPFVLALYPLEPGFAVHEVIQPAQAYTLA